MIRLTVSYNLPKGSDVDEFLAWRLGEHQQANESMPGVIRTDFGRIIDSWPSTVSSFTFQTICEWPDRVSFEHSFYEEAVQLKLKKDLLKLDDYEFTITEVLNN